MPHRAWPPLPQPAPLSSDDVTIEAGLRVFGLSASLRAGTAFPPNPNDGDLFYRVDENRTYRFDGSVWIPQDYVADSARIANAIIGTAHIVDAAITNAKIANLAVTDAKINDLNASKITAGTIDVNRLGAGSITVEKLIVGSFDNLIQDPGAESGATTIAASVHDFDDGGGTWTIGDGTTTSRSGRYFWFYNPSGQTGEARLNFNGPLTDLNVHPAATEGDQFYLEFWARNSAGTGTANDVFAQLLWYDETGTFLSAATGTVITPTTSWQKVSVNGTAPAGTAYVVFRAGVQNDGLANGIRFDDAYARRMVATTIIEDAAITSAKIGNAQITDAHISSLSADKITTGTLNADNVTVTGTLNAAALNIDGSRVTLGTIANARIASLLSGKTYRGDGAASAPAHSFDSDTDSGLRLNTAGNVYMQVGAGNQMLWTTTITYSNNDFRPQLDNTYGLGSSGRRWTDVWAVDGTINTSDPRLKADFQDTDLGWEFIRRVRFGRWRWKETIDQDEYGRIMAHANRIADQVDELDDDDPKRPRLHAKLEKLYAQAEAAKRPGRRWHHGVDAAQVRQVLDELGDPDDTRFGGLIGTTGIRPHEWIAPLGQAIKDVYEELDRRLVRLENG